LSLDLWSLATAGTQESDPIEYQDFPLDLWSLATEGTQESDFSASQMLIFGRPDRGASLLIFVKGSA
jgi:hypothetical protein